MECRLHHKTGQRVIPFKKEKEKKKIKLLFQHATKNDDPFAANRYDNSLILCNFFKSERSYENL